MGRPDQKINTVLFDFDGTLMDTNDIIIQSWQHTFKAFEGKERPLSEILATFGEPLVVTMANLLPQISVEEGVEVYRSYQVDHYRDLIELFPGMKELVQELKEKGYKVAVVTSRLKKSTMIGLDKYEMRDWFDCIITADDTDKHKPDPAPVLAALEKLGAGPDEAIMIGDSIFDIQCAHNAGVKAVLVGWNMAGEAQKTLDGNSKPDYTIQKAEELLPVLGETESE